jgi:DNA repair exonuclease SbcCD ATPase subunit
MAKSDSTPLIDAAGAFDEELASYARLGELFLKTPLTSLKHLERANQTIGELAECEQRLQASGQRLVQALSAARELQEGLATQIVEYAPQVQARNDQLKALMSQLGELATTVASVNAKVLAKPSDEAAPGAAPAGPDPAEVSAEVLALSARAEQLAVAARDASFEELASQAHALFQRLKTIAQKLQRAAGN